MTKTGTKACRIRVGALYAVIGSISLTETLRAEQYFIDRETSLGLIRGVELSILDEITGGCWTNTSLIKQKIRLILEQSAIAVYEKDVINNPFFQIVHLQASGFELGGVCFGNVDFKVMYYDYKSWERSPTINTFVLSGPLITWNKGIVFANFAKLDQQIVEFAEEAASEFSANVIEARREQLVL